MPRPHAPVGPARGPARFTPLAAVAAITTVSIGCAPPTNTGPTPVPETSGPTRREVTRAGSGLIEYHPDPNRARVIDLRVPTDSLWLRVIAAYNQLGLPLGEVDTKTRTLGTSSVRALGRLGGTPLSEYLDCGPAPLNARAADTYVVTLRATTELTAAAGTAPYTTVRTLVEAVAKANTTQGDPVDCVSTGRLETRLVRLIASPDRKGTGR